MNHLLVGTADKTEQLLTVTKPRFLLIDDGSIADAFLERFPKARVFDPTLHSFNPLGGMDYKRARDFADTVYGDKDLMTYRDGKRALVKILKGAKQLDNLPAIAHKGYADAQETIDDLLESPLLKAVLCGGGKPFKFGEGTTVAKLDRAVLGDFDAFLLGSLLIGQHQGQIIVPDFGFYGRPLHLSLIRQGRLTAGLNTLSELGRPDDKFRQGVLTIKDRKNPPGVNALRGVANETSGLKDCG
jgi:hypothetical protein